MSCEEVEQTQAPSRVNRIGVDDVQRAAWTQQVGCQGKQLRSPGFVVESTPEKGDDDNVGFFVETRRPLLEVVNGEFRLLVIKTQTQAVVSSWGLNGEHCIVYTLRGTFSKVNNLYWCGRSGGAHITTDVLGESQQLFVAG